MDPSLFPPLFAPAYVLFVPPGASHGASHVALGRVVRAPSGKATDEKVVVTVVEYEQTPVDSQGFWGTFLPILNIHVPGNMRTSHLPPPTLTP